MICVVCESALSSNFIEREGIRFCESHASEPRCTFCPTPRSWMYDGFTYCRTCARTIVRSSVSARAIIKDVGSFMAKRRIMVPTPVTIRVVDSRWLASANMHYTPPALGITQTAYYPHSAIPEEVEITVRKGLPDIICRATIAHEYGHAFMSHQGLFGLPLDISEGFAQFASYSYLRYGVATKAARAECDSIKARSDIYGVGFRRVSTVLKQIGMQEFILRLQLNQAGPFNSRPTR